MGKKSKGADFVGKIPKGVWLLISLVVALILWTVLSIIPSTSRCFPNAIKVIGSIQTMVSRGLLFKDIGSNFRITWFPDRFRYSRSGCVPDGMVQTCKIHH